MGGLVNTWYVPRVLSAKFYCQADFRHRNFILSIRIQKEFQGQINRNLQISILKSECLARLNKRT